MSFPLTGILFVRIRPVESGSKNDVWHKQAHTQTYNNDNKLQQP